MVMYKDGAKVMPPVLTAPIEIYVTAKTLEPALVQIDYDKDGLHFITPWGMISARETDLIEGEIVETSNPTLPPLYD